MRKELLAREDLYEYQNYCVDFIKAHKESALFLSCGLGKTIITLTALNDLLLDDFEVSKILVIAPLRVTLVWAEEIHKWGHLRFLDVALVTGGVKKREAALQSEAVIHIVNRENVPWLVEYFGRDFPYDCVVLDELSSFKNHRAQRVKALKKVRPYVKRWIGLTASPATNNLLDLWSEFFLLDGGERLGRYIGRYREAYFRAGAMNPKTGIVYSYVLRDGAEEQIYNRINDITVSMKAIDYLPMPECLYVNREVSISMESYEKFKRELVLSIGETEIDASNAAVLSNKLIQMANGCIYDDERMPHIIHNAKLDALEDLIESAYGQPVLVAYWFQHDRARILERFLGIREIKNAEDITDWNEGLIPVALIHPASAGHGLNLQAGGHILIWFSLTWSLELYQQTNARLWRQGQKNPVTIYHIIAKATIDEDIMRALSEKNSTQERLIEAVKASLSS